MKSVQCAVRNVKCGICTSRCELKNVNIKIKTTSMMTTTTKKYKETAKRFENFLFLFKKKTFSPKNDCDLWDFFGISLLSLSTHLEMFSSLQEKGFFVMII